MKKIIVVEVENYYDSYDTVRHYFTNTKEGFRLALKDLYKECDNMFSEEQISDMEFDGETTYEYLQTHNCLRYNDDCEAWSCIYLTNITGPDYNVMDIE